MKWKNLVIVGTSHVAIESVQNVKNAILNEKPEIVAVELDRQRFYALQNRQEDRIGLDAIRHVGLAGFIFALIGRQAQRHFSGKTGVKPGEEFLTAARLAKSLKIPVAFIDREIEVTLRRFSKSLSLRELLRIIADVVTSPFKRETGLEIINLNEIPDEALVRKLIGQVRSRYPNIYRTLIQERDEFMAERLVELLRQHSGTIVAVVGAGHQEELLALVKEKFSIPSFSFHTTVFV